MRDKVNEYFNGFYYITDEECSAGKTNIETVKLMLDAGAKIIQYRDKNKTQKEKYEEATVISKLCKKKKCMFIVNDNVDLALAVDADGVHIGQTDLPVDVVRKLIGEDKVIGLSTHCVEDADEANMLDIDYVGVGPIFETPKKDYFVGYDYMDYALKNIIVPCVIIGGIKSEHLDELKEKGAKCICMVSEMTSKDNIKKFVRSLNFENNK